MTIGIYCITEISTGLCYIGQSKSIERRWKTHHARFPLHRFTYSVLMLCPEEDLNRCEVDFISRWDSHRNGFNKTIGGTSIKATHPDADTLAKLSAWQKGKTFSEEHRAKLSAAAKVKSFSPEHREKLSASRKGKTHSDETRAKMSALRKGRKGREGRLYSDETLKKMSAAQKGRTLSPEHREKISAGAKERQRRHLQTRGIPKEEALA